MLKLTSFPGTQSRYQVKDFPDGGALLRIEPVRPGRDDATYECVAENGVGDAVSAEATLVVFEGKSFCTLHDNRFMISERKNISHVFGSIVNFSKLSESGYE